MKFQYLNEADLKCCHPIVLKSYTFSKPLFIPGTGDNIFVPKSKILRAYTKKLRAYPNIRIFLDLVFHHAYKHAKTIIIVT